MTHKQVKEILMEDFVLQYINDNNQTSCVDQNFHNEFAKQFGYKQKPKLWGAMPCRKAMAILKKLYDSNILERNRISICGSEGFSTWVWAYSIKT